MLAISVFDSKIKLNFYAKKKTGPPEQGGGGGGGGGKGVVSPPQSFLSAGPFFRRALEMPFLKEVTKNVHENYYSIRVN